MMRPRRLRRILTLAAFGAMLAGTTIGTGIAKADPMDGAYIRTLDKLGVTYSTPAVAILVGHQVCAEFDASPDFTSGVLVALDEFGFNDVGFVVGAAIGAYCPEHEGLIPDVTEPVGSGVRMGGAL